jgi:hypothetical protein
MEDITQADLVNFRALVRRVARNYDRHSGRDPQ